MIREPWRSQTIGKTSFSCTLPNMETQTTAVPCLHTISYVSLVDPDKAVSVRSALLVPPAQSVEHLMHDNPLEVAALTDGDVLWPSSAANVGETAAE